MFENCSSPTSRCGIKDNYLNGEAGLCNETTQLCECPEGYSGEDLFIALNDCHIHIATKHGVQVWCTATVCLALLCTLLGVLRLLVRWRIIYWHQEDGDQFAMRDVEKSSKDGQRGDLSAMVIVEEDQDGVNKSMPNRHGTGSGILMSSATFPNTTEETKSNQARSSQNLKRRNTLKLDMGELQIPRTNAQTNQFQQVVAERRRRRITLTLLTVWFCFGVSALVFQVLRHLGSRVEHRNPLMLLSLFVSFTSAVWGLWLFTYVLFSSLPGLRNYSTMFPSVGNSCLIRYPKCFQMFVACNCILVFLLGLAVFLIVPLLVPSFAEGSLMLPVSMSVLGSTILFFMVAHFTVCYLLTSMFRTLRSVSGGILAVDSSGVNRNGPSSELNGFKESERTVRMIVIVTAVLGPLFTVWVIVVAFFPIAFRYTYFFFSFLYGGGSLVSLFVTYILVFRLGPQQRAHKGSVTNFKDSKLEVFGTPLAAQRSSGE